jgi:glyoxylase-like metal-dependent hydrolase (beta-lactamase superfamily II)
MQRVRTGLSTLLAAVSIGAVAAEPVPQAIAVAPNVYVMPGAAGEVGLDNQGRIGNAGFIVGEGGVIAVDTGTSYRHGQALLAAIRRVTSQPVRLALITHTRQEFLFGALAFREQGIPVQMHRRAAGLMRSRCERCLKTLKQTLGDEAMRGTEMFTPDREFNELQSLALIGRRIELLYFGHSSGPGDTAVFDAQSGVLFAGGLLDNRRVPDVQDSDLDGWRSALAALRRLPVKTVVPGHGPVGTASVIDAVDRYLVALRTRLSTLLRDGAALSEVPDAAALPEFAGWDQYETIHRRNASLLYVRLERDELFKQATSRER